MKLNDTIHGFRVIRINKIAEVGATLYELRHELCGTPLVYLEREDTNKTFAISFTTPPEDSTGVFHIIEHSVLCGSEKYPLRDPFAELLKGSLNTFLNAMTYDDRTVYPLSSRCEKDYLNLVGVYLDAVFAPLMLENPNIFRQEGWHLEYDKETDSVSYNGVVYNEMKGAYSSPDEIGDMALNDMLFCDVLYRHDSGGDPSCITSLTYEQFKAAHKKYYHPSNAKIILDGTQDLNKILPIINSYLSRYEKKEINIELPTAKERICPPKEIKYAISKGESDKMRARVLYGYVYSDAQDTEAKLTALTLADILTGSNASPLKKAILNAGLAKDVTIYTSRSKEQTVTLEIRDADETRIDEIHKTVECVIGELIKNGIDRLQITATLDNIEFKLREQDYGSLPTGIAYALSMFGTWTYGGAPEDALFGEKALSSLRAKVDSGYFEDSLAKMTVRNPHRATVIMLPDKTLAEKNARKEKKLLAEMRASLKDSELKQIIESERALRDWQETDEGNAAIASLPKLALSDISTKTEKTKTEISRYGDAEILCHDIKTNGIIYISMHFSASDLTKEELLPLSILASALTNVATQGMDVLTLQKEIKSNLGSLISSTVTIKKGGIPSGALKITASALRSKSDEIIRLTKEVLLGSKFDDLKEISNIVFQAKSQIEDSIISSGESVALARVEASVSSLGAINEYMTGYEAYLSLCDIINDRRGTEKLAKKMSELLKKLITQNRLTLSLAGDVDEQFTAKLVSVIPTSSESVAPIKIEPCADKYEYFLIPSKIAHAVMGGISEEAKQRLGVMRVVRSILSYEYLWNTVRVKSGAYGTGFVPRRDGNIAFYSYRDPSPARSLIFYKESADYLRSLAKNCGELDKFIIGAVGDYDILTTPRTEAMIATRDYLNGWTPDDEERIRRDMLAVTSDDLRIAADIIDNIAKEASICIVGGSDQLKALKKKPNKIIEI